MIFVTKKGLWERSSMTPWMRKSSPMQTTTQSEWELISPGNLWPRCLSPSTLLVTWELNALGRRDKGWKSLASLNGQSWWGPAAFGQKGFPHTTETALLPSQGSGGLQMLPTEKKVFVNEVWQRNVLTGPSVKRLSTDPHWYEPQACNLVGQLKPCWAGRCPRYLFCCLSLRQGRTPWHRAWCTSKNLDPLPKKTVLQLCKKKKNGGSKLFPLSFPYWSLIQP